MGSFSVGVEDVGSGVAVGIAVGNGVSGGVWVGCGEEPWMDGGDCTSEPSGIKATVPARRNANAKARIAADTILVFGKLTILRSCSVLLKVKGTVHYLMLFFSQTVLIIRTPNAR